MCIRDRYKDTIDTARESKSSEIAENLLRYFVSIKKSECFAACLYTCYELIEPDVAVELAWRNGLMEFAFPFFIQSMRDLRNEVGSLNKKVETLQRNEEKKAKEQTNIAHDFMPQQHLQILGPSDNMNAFPGAGMGGPMGGSMGGPMGSMGGPMGGGMGMPMGGLGGMQFP
eukprot:TRINITY_DN12497_c0_g1_i3.p1 TRINITY_DN12497_c0_g1~~TRINITY_DN12497_c0_g1_i3.p1  ORF type:complete len:171 (+),score=53.81 TRINITY_DN12497_c0_g1_i3:73-585(+)